MFFALNFGIFFSYYFFVPVIYSSLGLFMLFDMVINRKNKNIFSIFTKQNIIIVITTLILPTIFGFCYFVLPGLIENGQTAINHIITEGYIYRDLYSNFLMLIPLALFYIIYSLKNKKNSLSTIMLILCTVFTVYLLKKGLKAEASSYYYYKIYYLIWIVVLYMITQASFIMIESKQAIYIGSYICTYLIIIIASLIEIDAKISNINLLFNPNSYLKAYTDIYVFNYKKMNEEKTIYTSNQIKAINSLIKEAEDRSEIQINGGSLQMLWAKDLTEITDTDDIHELVIEKDTKESVKEWLNNKNKKYLILFDTSNKQIKEENKDYKIMHKSADIIILEKK